MAEFTSDVIVMGGGPAGAAAARLLSAWGHDVALITASAGSASLAESLPPSCAKLFAAIGILPDMEGAGFVASRGNSAAWGEPALRQESFRHETGWQVLRRDLDLLLLRAAEWAGAKLQRDSRVTSVDVCAPTDPLRVAVRAGRDTWRARWVLDASGRAGVLARRHRVRDRSPRTVALVGEWHHPAGWPLDDVSHTLIESYEDGWVWSVPVDAHTRHVAAMVDTRRTALLRQGGAQAMYAGELAKTAHVQRLLRGASRRGSAWAMSAATYHASRYAGAGWLLVGDAGCFLDPLSSAGVKKALASAYLAAVAVHTCLQHDSMMLPALQLFEQRERAAHSHFSALTAQHYAAAAAHHAHDFWRARASVNESAELTVNEPDVERDPRVRVAFEQLRYDRGVRLRPAARCTRVLQPTIVGREIVLQEHLVSAGAPQGVRNFRGVDLTELLDIARYHDGVPELYDAYARVHQAVQLPDFVGAVSALVAFGMLERTGTAQPSNLELP